MPSRAWQLALPVATLSMWTTRIRNIVDDDWSAAELIVPVGLTVLAVAAVVRRWPWLAALAGATVAVWAVRVPLVFVRDHGVGFKVVHVALAAVSVYLAVRAWQVLRPAVVSRA